MLWWYVAKICSSALCRCWIKSGRLFGGRQHAPKIYVPPLSRTMTHNSSRHVSKATWHVVVTLYGDHYASSASLFPVLSLGKTDYQEMIVDCWERLGLVTLGVKNNIWRAGKNRAFHSVKLRNNTAEIRKKHINFWNFAGWPPILSSWSFRTAHILSGYLHNLF